MLYTKIKMEHLLTLENQEKNMDAINDIVSTMSKKDKELLNLSGDVYQRNIDEGANVVKRIIEKVGDTAVSFLDITGDRSGVSISIGTRGGDEYRNKGYASTVAKKGKKWLDEHADEFDQVVWWARKDNPGSIKIAQKIGLELDESSVLPDDPWIKYERKKMNTSYFGRMNSKKFESLKKNGVSIARSARYWNGPSYPPLFPMWEMIKCLNEEEYEKMYRRDVLDKLDPLQVWNDLGDDAILLCHESIDKIESGETFCHRHIAVRWLEEELWCKYDIDVTIDEVTEKDAKSLKFDKRKYEQLKLKL